MLTAYKEHTTEAAHLWAHQSDVGKTGIQVATPKLMSEPTPTWLGH